MKWNCQGSGGVRRRCGGPISKRDDRVERRIARRISDDLRRACRVLEMQRKRPILPGVVKNMTAVAPKDHLRAQLPSRFDKCARLIAGGRC